MICLYGRLVCRGGSVCFRVSVACTNAPGLSGHCRSVWCGAVKRLIRVQDLTRGDGSRPDMIGCG